MGLEVTGLEDMLAELQRLADPKVAVEATKRAVRAGAVIVFERVLANVPVREFEATEETTGLPKGAMKASLDVFDDSYADGSVSSTVAFGKDEKHAARLVEEGHRKVHGGKEQVGEKMGFTTVRASRLASCQPIRFLGPQSRAVSRK